MNLESFVLWLTSFISGAVWWWLVSRNWKTKVGTPSASHNIPVAEIAWLNETLKMINLRGHYTDINESLIDRISERIAQLRNR